MGKTKTNTTKLPRGSLEPQSPNQNRKHLDRVNLLLAEEHYGKYLLVKNNRSNRNKHNRFYLSHEAMLEFLEVSEVNPSLIENYRNNGIAFTHLISLFPEREDMIVTTLHSLIDERMTRNSVKSLILGFSHLLMVFKKLNMPLISLSEIDGVVLKVLLKDAKANVYYKHSLNFCVQFLRLVRSYYGKNFEVPKLGSYALVNMDGKKELSSDVSWQLDIYARKELDETINLVNEYKEWMCELEEIQAPFTHEELNQHGGIFTLKNLIFTYFDNIDLHGKGAGGINRTIQKAAYSIYGVELRVWKKYANPTQAEKEAISFLKKQGEEGFNITIRDERMFAIWHKLIAPNFPFDNTISPQYTFLSKSLKEWREVYSSKSSIVISRFNRRIYPSKEVIYPLYLLSLCRSGLNQQPIKDWRVWKDEQSMYRLGEDSGMGRLVDGYKSRGDTIQTTALDKQHTRYVDFFCKYLTPLFERSRDDHFFQYISYQGSTALQSRINAWSTASIADMLSGTNHFFYKNDIQETEILPDGTCQQKRIYTIDHEQIRKVRNLSEYLQGKAAWERQYELGHKNIETGIFYEQTVGFKEVKQHRIAMTLNKLLDFIKGRVSEVENPKFKIFKGPLAHCQNPFEPDYVGAKPLRDGDVCTNWRKCLSGCSKCQPIKSVHGPNIMAWRIVMKELRSVYIDQQEWERIFWLDDQVAKATIEACNFTKEEWDECEKRAKEPGRLDFIRREVLNSQKSRQLTQEEREHA